jgi:general nucleoside transport system permease protein
MDYGLVAETIRSVIASSTPLVFAGIGELLTERSGVVNLSLDGSILVAAMFGFAVASLSGSLMLGFALAMIVGALIALLVASSSIFLRQDQVAVGLVLTLLMAEVSSFVGRPFVRIPGPSVGGLALPGLSQIPVIGTALFDQNILVYLSYLLIIGVWVWLFHTQPGLHLRSVGERPEAAFSRGIPVNRLRLVYSALGGALVGAAGAAYSLNVKLGWSHRATAGLGWIALAIVIFGGWHPLKVALGAYLFGALKSLGSLLQPVYPDVPSQVFQVAPFAMMIVALLLVSGDAVRVERRLPERLRPLAHSLLHGTAPAGLGRRFEQG